MGHSSSTVEEFDSSKKTWELNGVSISNGTKLNAHGAVWNEEIYIVAIRCHDFIYKYQPLIGSVEPLNIGPILGIDSMIKAIAIY